MTKAETVQSSYKHLDTVIEFLEVQLEYARKGDIQNSMNERKKAAEFCSEHGIHYDSHADAFDAIVAYAKHGEHSEDFERVIDNYMLDIENIINPVKPSN